MEPRSCRQHTTARSEPILSETVECRCNVCGKGLDEVSDMAECCSLFFCCDDNTSEIKKDCLGIHQDAGHCIRDEPVKPMRCPPCLSVITAETSMATVCCKLNMCVTCFAEHKVCDTRKPELKTVDIKPESVKVSESGVSLLEHWLEMAKAGELSDVILVGIAGDVVIHGASKTMNFLSRLGAVEAAKMEWYHEDVLHRDDQK